MSDLPMSDPALDELDRMRFDWPEPILIDLICEQYRGTADANDRITAARRHARFLHELIEGVPRRSAFLRLELIACCAPNGISMQMIEAADDAAFQELTGIIESRFRNSPRMRFHFLERLDNALARLPERSQPRRTAATVRVLTTARNHWERPAQQSVRKLVVNG